MKVTFRSVVTRVFEVADEDVEELYHTTDQAKIQVIERASVEDDPQTIFTDSAEWVHEVTVGD